MNWNTAGDVAFYAVAGISVLFVVLYTVLSPWWKTATGRNIMFLMSMIAAITGYFAWAINQDGELPHGFYPVRFGLFAGLATAIGWRVVIFVRAQVLARRSKEGTHEVVLEDPR